MTTPGDELRAALAQVAGRMEPELAERLAALIDRDWPKDPLPAMDEAKDNAASLGCSKKPRPPEKLPAECPPGFRIPEKHGDWPMPATAPTTPPDDEALVANPEPQETRDA